MDRGGEWTRFRVHPHPPLEEANGEERREIIREDIQGSRTIKCEHHRSGGEEVFQRNELSPSQEGNLEALVVEKPPKFSVSSN